MLDFLIHATLNNLIVSTILAVIARAVQRRFRSPVLANLLWALVLIKMVTPPLLAIPIVEVPSISGSSIFDRSVQQGSFVGSNSPDLDLEFAGTSTHSENPLIGTNGTQTQAYVNAFGAGFVKFTFAVWLFEEMACDALVLETATSEVSQYANSLLNMAELLVPPAIRPPVVASAINNGGSLEQRLNMMITGKTKRVPAVLRMAVVAIATCVLPLGFVYAQDFEAVEKRLGGAVEAGVLSLEQAVRMMDALRESGVSQEMDAKKQRYMKYTNKIKAAVEAGKLSEEDAEEKLIAVRREMFEREGRKDGEDREMEAKKRRYIRFVEEVKAAVEVGKLSEEDAEEKLIAVRRDMFERERGKDGEDQEMEAKKRRYMEFVDEIEGAVKAGKLSEEDAEKKLIAVRREMFESDDRKDGGDREIESKRRKYMEKAREIEAAVEAGKVTKENAEKRYIELRKKLFE